MNQPQKLILLVEDNIQAQKLTTLLLNGKDFEVETAATLAQARAFIERATPDAIILDRGLPDGDGLNFLRELRETSKIPVLMLTGQNGNGGVMAGYDESDTDYLIKPTTFDIIFESLNRLLENAEHRNAV